MSLRLFPSSPDGPEGHGCWGFAVGRSGRAPWRPPEYYKALTDREGVAYIHYAHLGLKTDISDMAPIVQNELKIGPETSLG